MYQVQVQYPFGDWETEHPQRGPYATRKEAETRRDAIISASTISSHRLRVIEIETRQS